MARKEEHIAIFRSTKGWFAQRTPQDEVSGPWSTKEAAEAALRGQYFEAHRLENSFTSGVQYEVKRH